MRIVRFVGEDGGARHGEDRGDGSATILLDPDGVLGAVTADGLRERYRGKRAMVADDDDHMRQLMSATLEKAGCSCIVCDDGEQAIRAIEQETLDLVVTDIVMPYHDGYEIFAAAKARRADLPVVLVTGFGYDPNHVLLRASREGHSSVLYKPFSPRQLLDEVDRAVREKLRAPADALVRTANAMEIGEILAPIQPLNVICIGRNWRDPRSTGAFSGADESLEVFLKPSSSVQAPGAPIVIPDFDGIDPQIDCEGELAVIIGAPARNVSEEEARKVVLGYTAANDVTARRWQTSSGPSLWMRGKGFDTFCPLGPVIVTDSDLDPSRLVVRTLIDDVPVREGSTRDMVRSVPAIVSELSRHLTLGPGTVVLTGAPPASRDPEPLLPGQEVVVEIEGIGRLVNRVEA